MTRVLLVDGENLKGYLKSVFNNADKKRPDWHEYDFAGLFNRILKDIYIEKRVFLWACF